MISNTRSRARSPGGKEFRHDVRHCDTRGFEIDVERAHGQAGEGQQGHEPHALARRPPARDAGGMAKPVAKLLSIMTPKRRWAQFSLATMFVVMTMLCVWLSAVVNRANRQRDAVTNIEALGGSVYYWDSDQEQRDQEASETFPKPFLRRWLPRDYFDEVRIVEFDGTEVVTDAGLVHLQGLTGMRELNLDHTQVTDAGLAHLHGLTGLVLLSLNGTQVTGAGLAHLQALNGLEWIHLDGTRFTDASLAHVQTMTRLKWLSLDDTQVTDVGLAHLRGLTRLEWLYLGGTQVTDVGLAHLHGLTGLRQLFLNRTQISVAGLKQIRQALPNCQIEI